MNNHKELNGLYEQCNRFIGKILTEEDNTISIKFGVTVNQFENGEYRVRRNDVNMLYFNILDSLLPKDGMKDLYEIRSFIRANDRDGFFIKKIENIVDTLSNGNSNY